MVPGATMRLMRCSLDVQCLEAPRAQLLGCSIHVCAGRTFGGRAVRLAARWATASRLCLSIVLERGKDKLVFVSVVAYVPAAPVQTAPAGRLHHVWVCTWRDGWQECEHPHATALQRQARHLPPQLPYHRQGKDPQLKAPRCRPEEGELELPVKSTREYALQQHMHFDASLFPLSTPRCMPCVQSLRRKTP